MGDFTKEIPGSSPDEGAPGAGGVAEGADFVRNTSGITGTEEEAAGKGWTDWGVEMAGVPCAVELRLIFSLKP